MIPYIITSKELPAYQEEIMPLIHKCIDRAYHGEMQADDVIDLIKQDLFFCVIGVIDNKIELLSVYEDVCYPRINAVNCVLLAGRSPGVMIKAKQVFLNNVLAHFRQSGIEMVECIASPSMTKILSELGFVKMYDLFRLEI